MVICLDRAADLHMAQLMPLRLTVSCFSKIQIGFTFLVPAHPGSPRQGPLIGCVCVLLYTWWSICVSCIVWLLHVLSMRMQLVIVTDVPCSALWDTVVSPVNGWANRHVVYYLMGATVPCIRQGFGSPMKTALMNIPRLVISHTFSVCKAATHASLW